MLKVDTVGKKKRDSLVNKSTASTAGRRKAVTSPPPLDTHHPPSNQPPLKNAIPKRTSTLNTTTKPKKHCPPLQYLGERDLSLVPLGALGQHPRPVRAASMAAAPPLPACRRQAAGTAEAQGGAREGALDADAQADVVGAGLVVRTVHALDLRETPARGRPEPIELFFCFCFPQTSFWFGQEGRVFGGCCYRPC